MGTRHIIKFPAERFRTLTGRLLEDASREAFAVLLAKHERVSDGLDLYMVRGVRFALHTDYEARGGAHLRLTKQFVYRQLAEIQERYDLDTIIDVHTHPFSSGAVCFSAVDDADEARFQNFLSSTLDDIKYCSIVLSRSEYDARAWHFGKGGAWYDAAEIAAQSPLEYWPCSRIPKAEDGKLPLAPPEWSNRTIAALGKEFWARSSSDNHICIIGAGGLGSVVAENLVQLGFSNLVLIDHDTADVTNLNRVAGLYERDAKHGVPKVRAVKKHLVKINTDCKIWALIKQVQDPRIIRYLSTASVIVLATDNHSSRAYIQDVCLKYYVPLISVGVNIEVREDAIVDISGEIISLRPGDNICLYCLRRLDPIKIAYERHPTESIRQQLSKRGYVTGADVKEPAVKTLNSVVASIACDKIVNFYTGRQPHTPIVVYENNVNPAIYEDIDSVRNATTDCFNCSVADDV